MTDSEIDTLIKWRNSITDRRDIEALPYPDTSEIDAQLATVEPGRDNRVDLLLGRMCAVLTEYAPPVGWFQSQDATLELSAEEIDDLIARTAETATEPPTYDGMWM